MPMAMIITSRLVACLSYQCRSSTGDRAKHLDVGVVVMLQSDVDTWYLGKPGPHLLLSSRRLDVANYFMYCRPSASASSLEAE